MCCRWRNWTTQVKPPLTRPAVCWGESLVLVRSDHPLIQLCLTSFFAVTTSRGRHLMWIIIRCCHIDHVHQTGCGIFRSAKEPLDEDQQWSWKETWVLDSQSSAGQKRQHDSRLPASVSMWGQTPNCSQWLIHRCASVHEFLLLLKIVFLCSDDPPVVHLVAPARSDGVQTCRFSQFSPSFRVIVYFPSDPNQMCVPQLLCRVCVVLTGNPTQRQRCALVNDPDMTRVTLAALSVRRTQFAAENGGHVKKKYTPKFSVNSAWDFHLFIDIPLLAHSQRSCRLCRPSPASFYPSSHFTFPSLYFIILWVKREQAPNPDTRENPVHFQQPNIGRCIEWVYHL